MVLTALEVASLHVCTHLCAYACIVEKPDWGGVHESATNLGTCLGSLPIIAALVRPSGAQARPYAISVEMCRPVRRLKYHVTSSSLDLITLCSIRRLS